MKDFANLEGYLFGLLFMGIFSPVLELSTKSTVSSTVLMVSIISVVTSLFTLSFVKKRSKQGV